MLAIIWKTGSRRTCSICKRVEKMDLNWMGISPVGETELNLGSGSNSNSKRLNGWDLVQIEIMKKTFKLSSLTRHDTFERILLFPIPTIDPQDS